MGNVKSYTEAAMRRIVGTQGFSKGLFIGGGVVLIALAALIIFNVSSDSLPGQPLYNVKTSLESAHYAFTPSLLGKANVRIEQGDQRLWELQQLDQRPTTIDEFVAASKSIVAADNSTMQALDVAKRHHKDIKPLVKRFCGGITAQQKFLKILAAKHPGLVVTGYRNDVAAVDEAADHAMEW